MTFLSNIGSACAGFLFGVSLARSNTRAVTQAYDKGLNTPGPGTTTVNADTATVQGGDPTNVVTTPVETRNAS